jgi:hypothetical protein
MGRRLLYDKTGTDALVARQSRLITRSQALSFGLTDQALRVRLRVDGPWQVLLPGVYATFTGGVSSRQRELAALLYCGPKSAITGQAAMAAHGIKNLGRTTVDVLIPAGLERRDQSFVHVLRTSRMPDLIFRAGELRYVPVARAVADAARQLRALAEVRTVVASAVQRSKVTVAELGAELAAGPTVSSALFRTALVEVADGIRSTAEADLRLLIKRAGLPDPYYNPWLYLGEEFVARPDAWWADAGVAVEVESRQWHLSPTDWERTMERGSRMSAVGINVLQYPPSKLRAERRSVAGQIGNALEVGRRRPQLPIRTVAAH